MASREDYSALIPYFWPMNPSSPVILRKQDWYLIGACWLATQLIILWYFGINDGGESAVYIEWSKNWLAGVRHYNLNVIFYAGYIAIHVLLRWLGLPVKSMYGVQLLLSALSVYYFVRILARWVQSRAALVLTAILYSTCYIIQLYVSMLYTESVFCDLLLIGSYYLLTASPTAPLNSAPQGNSPLLSAIPSPHLRNRIICWIFILLLPFFRPVGFLFTALACCYWATTSLRRNRWQILAGIAWLACVIILINISLESPGFFYPGHNAEANIICGYPSDLLQYRQVPYHEGMSTFGYLLRNPNMTIRLFAWRFYKVFSLPRPYYSTGHNLVLGITSITYCLLALTGLYQIFFRRSTLPKYFLPFAILLFSLPCVALCVDWEGRFSLPVYGFLLLAAGIGLDAIPFIRSQRPKIQ